MAWHRSSSRRERGAARSGWDSEHDAFLGHEMRGPAGTERGGVSMAGGREGQSARKGEWGETIETKWSKDGLRLKRDNLRRCCRLQDGLRAQCKGRVRADGVASLHLKMITRACI